MIKIEEYCPAKDVEIYVNGVVSGQTVACEAIVAACRRHNDDLQRQRTDDFPYYYDAEHAAAVCLFFPTMVKHSIGKDEGKPFFLQPWQAFAVSSIFGWKSVEDDTRRFSKAYISVARKNGKAESLDSVLPTPTGTTTMGEVEEGDYLIGRDGEPVRVLATSEIWEDRPVYQVEFSDGEVVECDGNHEWVYLERHRKGGRGEKKRVWFSEETVETKWLAEQELADGNGAKFRIPNAVFQGQHKELPIDPYTLGAWLGDGDTNGQRITCHRDDLPNLLDNIDGFETRLVSNGGKGRDVRVVSMLGWNPAARGIGVLGNKHIPEVYFTASVEQRVALLQGLMDTDGSISKSGQCEFTQKKGRLATDVKRLLASIGIYSKCKTSDMKLDGKIVGEKQRIMFFPPDYVMPFRLDRKAKRVRKKKKDGTRKIVRVEYVRQDRTKCVQVEGGVYMTGNYVLTHNSTLAAAMCLFCSGFDWNPVSKTFEGVSQVVLAASKKEQADRVTMAECIRMRSRSETISGMSIHQNKQITFGHNNGHIITVGSDKAFDGLNPHVVQIDEMHAFRSTGNQAEFISTMKTGSGARVQPIYLVTTTAGSTASVLWKSEWEYAIGVAKGDIADDSYFTLSYELDEDDDPLDENNWIKANPCLGVTLTIDYLRDQAKPAAADKVGLNRFTRYHGNRLVSNLDSAFDVEQWDDCAGELSDWREADAICCGIDLGGRDDLASLSLVARFDTGETSEDEDALPIYRYEVRCWNYLATDTVRDIAAEPFASFIDKGLIRTTKFPVSELERDTVRECLEYGAQEVAIDPYQAQATGERLETEGLLVASMTQSCRHFNEPITELRQAISDGRFRHDGNPVLRWMIGNAVLISDRNDRVMFSKKDSAEKIDGVVSMTMAFGRAMLSPSKAKGYFTT